MTEHQAAPSPVVYVLTLFAMLLLLPGDDPAAADWEVEQFEVVEAIPEMLELVVLNPINNSGTEPEGRPTNAELGALLNDIGRRFRDAGFGPPRLFPVVDVDGVPTYRTYLFPYENFATTRSWNKKAGYVPSCEDLGFSDTVTWLSVNKSSDVTSIDTRKRYLGGLSHEFMHALADNDGLGEDCNLRAYTATEGIPEGARMVFFRDWFPGYLGQVTTNRSGVGLRSYAVELTFGDDIEKPNKSALATRTGYGLGSMWFFVAERFGGLKVFPHFTARPLAQDASPNDVVRWIDEGLGTLPGLRDIVQTAQTKVNEDWHSRPGLYEVFPAFVSEFASYGGTRYMSFAGTRFHAAQFAREVWFDEAFNGCKRYTLSPTARTARIPMRIGRNSARCFRIEFKDFEGNVSIQTEVIGDRLDLLDQLHLGWAWKEGPRETENCYQKREALQSQWPPCVFKAFIEDGPRPGTYTRTWSKDYIEFGVGENTNAERTYILSNLAPKPWKSRMYLDFEIKVAANVAAYNGKPAEPIGPLPHRRKSSPASPRSTRTPAPAAAQAATAGATSSAGASPGNPLFGELGKPELYGLQTDPVIRDDAPMGFTLQAYAPGGDTGDAGAGDNAYAVTLHNLDYGDTGPVYGMVALAPSARGGRPGVVSSMLCEGARDRPIGEVLQSDEDAFRVILDTSLCRVDGGSLTQCEDGCPVVDQLSADVHMAFGWRQFPSTAPTHIVTPGIRRYVATMPDTLSEALGFGAGTALPGMDTPGAGPGASSGPAVLGTECACTCEERDALLSQLESLKKGFEEGGDANAALRKSGALQSCFGTCQREYLVCVFEADERRKAAEKQAALEAQRAAAEACDCSCAGIEKMSRIADAARERQASGGGFDIEEMNFLSTCYTECSDEVLACQRGR